MQFEKTNTYQNLARAFAGECQAGMRYQMIAKLAMQEKMKTLSDAIKTIAKNETVHATQFFNKMIEKGGSKDNVVIDEGFKDISKLFLMIADVEKQHKIIFNYLTTAVKEGTLYKSPTPMIWVCSECGYMHVATEAWKVCPLCKAEQGYVQLHLPFEGVKE